LNNLEACLLIFFGGVSLGAISILIIILNGFVIGSVIASVRGEHGFLFLAAAILPHGLFEIPAFVIAGALGLSLAREVWLETKGRGDAANVAQSLGMVFIKVVVPLISLAAFIEAFITPYILTLVT
jgi:stage II sporulation protein M